MKRKSVKKMSIFFKIDARVEEARTLAPLSVLQVGAPVRQSVLTPGGLTMTFTSSILA